VSAPDPLGKRALYWAPAEREEGPHRQSGDVTGKHALYSKAGVVRGRPGRAPATGGGASARSQPSPEAVTGAALGSDFPAEAEHLKRPASSGMFGSLTLHCSSCRAESQVDLVEFIVLHLPLWLWRPGRGHTSFMTCPACRRRTWMSTSWASSPR
jgi:hypothetical protein